MLSATGDLHGDPVDELEWVEDDLCGPGTWVGGCGYQDAPTQEDLRQVLWERCSGEVAADLLDASGLMCSWLPSHDDGEP